MRLTFGSSLKVDYIIDTSYRWSIGKLFTGQVNYVDILPGQTKLLGSFTHSYKDYLAGAGQHTIRAEVIGYDFKEAVVNIVNKLL